MRPNTRLLYIETPSNPLMAVTDIAAVAALAKAGGALCFVDSTFATPYHSRPLAYEGVSLVLHSATKYLGGHSDLLAGAAASNDARVLEQVGMALRLFGCALSAFDAYLLIRGLKTLDVRMERHAGNALAIARFLSGHPRVSAVYYPGLPSHPDAALAATQMSRGFGGMLSFDVRGGVEAGRRVVESVRIINLAVSLGGVESLIEHAATMTHVYVPREQREASGITDGLIRLSVGLEDVRDLIADLEQALEAAAAAVAAGH
jgi:cystathionine beta-lyase/cystathionine gamma-synthase